MLCAPPHDGYHLAQVFYDEEHHIVPDVKRISKSLVTLQDIYSLDKPTHVQRTKATAEKIEPIAQS